jgi:hypothetical protein
MLAVPFKLNQDRRAAHNLRRPASTRPGHPHGADLADRVPPGAFRQTEGWISSVIGLLGLSLRVPDHTTLSRQAATLEGPRPHHRYIAEKGRIG